MMDMPQDIKIHGLCSSNGHYYSSSNNRLKPQGVVIPHGKYKKGFRGENHKLPEISSDISSKLSKTYIIFRRWAFIPQIHTRDHPCDKSATRNFRRVDFVQLC